MAFDRSAERRVRRARRHARVTKKVRGTKDRPRLVVFRSHKHMEGQLVDDDRGVTLLGISTQIPELEGAEQEGLTAKVARSFVAGRLLAERATKAGVESVIFDRGGYQYHGRVKAFAEGARDGGLKF
ncbi:MAG: 50S ribosomal protein L18 [Gemmatimonadota bacterium]